MAVLQTRNSVGSAVGTCSADPVMQLDEIVHHILTCKELDALRRGEIGEQEAATRIAVSLFSLSECIAAPLHSLPRVDPTLASVQFSPRPSDIIKARIRGGKSWLHQNARRMLNQIEQSGIFEDTFSQFLIMEATNDTSLLHLHAYQDLETNEAIQVTMRTAKRRNYFLGEPVGTTKRFPADVDTTSYSLLAFTPTTGVDEILDDMLANRNSEGLVQTYWDAARPRTDICVLANVVRAFYKYARATDIQDCLAYVSAALEEGAYGAGTRHYCSPEEFLFFVARLVAAHPHAAELGRLRAPLASALAARAGVSSNQVAQSELDREQMCRARGEKYSAYIPAVDGLALAMRILACQALGIRPDGLKSDVEHLAALQDGDGGWPLAWLCRFGRSKLRIGNRGVVTAYAVQALEGENERRR